MDIDAQRYIDDTVYRSWADGRVDFRLEGGALQRGFRRPQRAAAFAVFSHLDADPHTAATVVMPTGTGKTDTIFAIIIGRLFSRTLLVVPSDALRAQISDRLGTLNRLREIGAINDAMQAPVVHRITGRDAALDGDAVRASNVSVATPAAFSDLNDEELAQALDPFTHVIFDEAHHVAAASWRRIQQACDGRPTIFFTATPFRLDEQRLGGKIIFNYSLRQAQLDGYFQEIEFFPVREYIAHNVDRAIAEKAVQLLRADRADARDHILVARCATIAKANEVGALYQELAPELAPVVMHSESPGNAGKLEDLRSRSSRIVVCVDMFGEGFDFPELKIAAIHDQHQSPAVTLQFIGRLTRTDLRLGTAKFVANIANQRDDGAIKRLYEENADWSRIIREISAERIGREVNRQEFEERFASEPDAARILSLNPTPNVSATAYTVIRANWQPNRVEGLDGPFETLEFHSVSATQDVVMAVTRESAPVAWASTESIQSTNWHLYLAYYRRSDRTLFITCTADDRQRLRFLKLITKDYTRIAEEATFRIMHGLGRLKLQNVGLSNAGRDVRFTMHVGQAVNRVLGDLEQGRSIKANIFGVGFAGGEKTTAGCSYKGKLWKMDSAGVDEWVAWCDEVAVKINDDGINPSDILGSVMRAELVQTSWPPGIFFADWPESLLVETEQRMSVTVDSASYPFLELALGTPVYETPSILAIPVIHELRGEPEVEIARIRVELGANGYRYVPTGATISSGRKSGSLESYLQEYPMRMLCADGSIVIGNYRHFSPSTLDVPLPAEHLSSWDWTGVEINRESMRDPSDNRSVQGFTFESIRDDYDVIFDDDGAGEVADLVAIREAPDHIEVHLYHCKYCKSGDTPGARVDDVYVVAGQASRSVRWLHQGPELFQRLTHRESQAQDKNRSRFLKGDMEQIDRLRRKASDVEMRMGFYIIQPAISVGVTSDPVRAVLGTSYKYIRDIAGVDLKVIGSA